MYSMFMYKYIFGKSKFDRIKFKTDYYVIILCMQQFFKFVS